MGLHCEWPETKPLPHDRVAKRQKPKLIEPIVDPQLQLAVALPKGLPDLFDLFNMPFDNILFGRVVPQLDDTGVQFLLHYSEAFCSFIHIGTDSLNYFLKTFMQLAQSRDSILYALCAWGGFWLQLRDKSSIDYSQPWNYMQKSAKLICKEIGDSLVPLNNEDFFVLLAFYLIFIGIEVTTGDVCHWGGFLTQCSNLIKSFGGLEAVAQMFLNNNDIKWLLHNFQFHDLLSLNAVRQGTLMPIEEYEAVLQDDVNYGIDPLQGTLGGVYNLFGDIGNSQVMLRRQWAEIEDMIEALVERSPELEEARRAYFATVRTTYKSLMEKISGCVQSLLHLQILELDPKELTLQRKLFELYVLICKIHLNTVVMRLPPSLVQQQDLLLQALELIDELLDTRMIVLLSLLILVCGMACCTSYDRDRMRERFRKAQLRYHVQNLTRIEETVEESWVRNPDGNVVIEWAALVEEKGWNLYVG